jgi:predicted neutral ceramidase superfamily lipid hydrolase
MLHRDKENEFLFVELCINAVALIVFFESNFFYGFTKLQIPSSFLEVLKTATVAVFQSLLH